MSYDVFISYRRLDGRELANCIAAELKSIGYRVFIDSSEMRSGKPFPEQLRKAVIETPNYILIVTTEMFNFREGEDWLKSEIETALNEYNKSPDTRTVLPIFTSATVYLHNMIFPSWCEQLKKFDSIDLCGLLPNKIENKRIAKAVSGVNRHNIWNAAQRYLEYNKEPGKRFYNLHICQSILPVGKKSTSNNLPIVGKTNNTSKSLLDVIIESSDPLYIIGEGGIGKTTSLIRIMEDAYEGKHYSENSIIPLFVELNLAPDNKDNNCYSDGKSTFIIRQVCNILKQTGKADSVFDYDVDTMEDELARIVTSVLSEDFVKNDPPPRYWLLLDGLNEVSQKDPYIYGMIIDEIIYLLTKCHNVRVILTDRNDETLLSCERYGIQKFILAGIDEINVRKYLSSQHIKVPYRKKEFELLKNPMFLTMYASLNQQLNIVSRGELLKQFFYERSENMYNQSERLTAQGYDINKIAFVLDFLIPAIAHHMERYGEYIIDRRTAENIVFPILEQDNDTDIIGYYGESAFEKYRKSSRITIASVAKSILNSFGGNKCEIIGFILDCAVKNLGILFDRKGKFGFVHQHIRDFFAAVYDVNTIKLAVCLYSENKLWYALDVMHYFSENVLSTEKARFIGEYLGEPQNKPYYYNEKWNYNVPDIPCDRNLIKRAFDIYRNRFDGNDGYAIYNLIEILKITRKDLSGCDFSYLDLSNTSINGLLLGHSGICDISSFEGAKINNNNIMNPVIDKEKYFVCRNSKTILFYDENEILEMDSLTGAVIEHYSIDLQRCTDNENNIDDNNEFEIDHYDSSYNIFQISVDEFILVLEHNKILWNKTENSFCKLLDKLDCREFNDNFEAKVDDLDYYSLNAFWGNGSFALLTFSRWVTNSNEKSIHISETFLYSNSNIRYLPWFHNIAEFLGIALSSDDNYCLIWYTNYAFIYSFSKDMEIAEIELEDSIIGARFLKSNLQIIIVTEKNYYLYDLNGKKIKNNSLFKSNEKAISVSFSPDTTRFSVVYGMGGIKNYFFDLENTSDIMLNDRNWVDSVDFITNDYVIIKHANGLINTRSLLTSDVQLTIKESITGKVCIDVSENNKCLIKYCNGTIREWNIDSQKCINTFLFEQNDIISLAYNKDATKFVCLSESGVIKIIDACSGKSKTIGKANKKSFGISFSDNQIVLITDPDTKKDEALCSDYYLTFNPTAKYEFEFNKEIREKFESVGLNQQMLDSIHINRYSNYHYDDVYVYGKNNFVIHEESGLFVHGCKFINLYPDSDLDKTTLKTFGAIVDDLRMCNND